jgi:hypothetical protein
MGKDLEMFFLEDMGHAPEVQSMAIMHGHLLMVAQGQLWWTPLTSRGLDKTEQNSINIRGVLDANENVVTLSMSPNQRWIAMGTSRSKVILLDVHRRKIRSGYPKDMASLTPVTSIGVDNEYVRAVMNHCLYHCKLPA